METKAGNRTGYQASQARSNDADSVNSANSANGACDVKASQPACGPRKPGPVPGIPTRKYNVLIEESLAEWAKGEPGGMSAMVRRLLKAERQRRAHAHALVSRDGNGWERP